ncbi:MULTISPECIES: GNAT family N-acetyltransferase [Roseivirga]|jgi:predicted N-acetyltransferase YhbS|uniref:N-acetyltransferase domain-containing protein n=1 Tax=Roseivirga thermotolerans TaxID=1758176 RepID=A0ABQ3I6V9_9BACT|nr:MULTISPECIES: GNAT family N-acetyltransferase [Roseivirga]MEC7755879.1 GNAT family N-acetyltransferase [Bacteroidota bacterium]GHE69307.1 hypothetical protein GCM10011340_26570 [Roseivirga thermotolerans]|tara:strand:- start:11437 stop:11982 length:546 start_codon:yes stop_codon:yes gene_type:complete
MFQVVSQHITQVIKEHMAKANELTDATWPTTKPGTYTSESRIQDFMARNPDKTCHFIWHNQQLIGYAESFPRKIGVNNSQLVVLGLGAVCVNTEYRGQGLGALLVRAAFERIDQGEFPLCLFQTGVPGFYHQLNCRTIENRIYNSTSETPEQNPFWDPYIMIYPSQFNGLQTDIDLLGAGY